jgi:hypothetical protein
MYAPRIIRPRFHWTTIGVTAFLCLAVGIGILLVVMRYQQAVPLPASIKQQVSFPVFLPTTGVTINKSSYKFDPSQKVLSFTGSLADGQMVTFAEQATPSSFTDIPNFYQQFLQALYDYQSFDGLDGTVHMTHPKGAGQAVVMSAKGTLLFARVSQDEPQSTWRSVFNSFRVYSW